MDRNAWQWVPVYNNIIRIGRRGSRETIARARCLSSGRNRVTGANDPGSTCQQLVRLNPEPEQPLQVLIPLPLILVLLDDLFLPFARLGRHER